MRMININMQVRILIVALSIIFHSQSYTQQFVQQGNKLVGTGAVGIVQQGIAVAISGDGNTAVVGG